jgi:penicillin-binding protein 2
MAATSSAGRGALSHLDQPPRRETDVVLLGAAGLLVVLGLANLLTLSRTGLAERQLSITLAGACGLVVLAKLPARHLAKLSWAGYVVTIGALLVVLLVGPAAKGARRWLDLGAFTVQPSEVAKVTLLVALASILAKEYDRRRLALAIGVAAVPTGLVLIQPDLSTALVLAALTGFMLVLARVPPLPLLPLFALPLALLPLAGSILRPYQVNRLEAFLSGDRDASGAGWSTLQAEIAVGTGGLFGQATRDPLFDVRAAYLPEGEHDLAFASLVHGWGLVAGLAVVAALLVIVWRATVASRRARSRQLALASAGVAVLFGVHAVVSIAGNVALLPVTGLPIPLFSYGGTTAAVHVAALGLVLAARRDGAYVWPLWDPPPGHRWHPRWARLIALPLAAILGGLGWFAWQLQEARSDELRQVSDQQMTRCIRLPAERGIITDRHGEPLVANAEQVEVHVIPGLFDETDATLIERLAAYTGQSPTALQEVIARRGPELMATVAAVPPAVAARIAEAELPGVLLTLAERREYPDGELLGTLLGFVGVGTPSDLKRWPDLPLGAMVGRAGLEQQYDAFLRGRDGRQCLHVDPRGRPAAVAERVDPVRGEDVQLHLDLKLQQRAATALREALANSGGDVGGAVVMDARSGAVLAMASVPSYDNNLYGPPVDTDGLDDAARAPGLRMLNHVTQVAAPPGSTYKLVVATANAAGSYQALSPRQVIPTGASYTYGGHTFRNWRAMPPHNLIDAIAWSNNVYFYELARRIGPDQIATVADRLGVGRPTGIDLPGESPGFLGTPDSVEARGGTWYGGSTILMGIGQGPLTTTPLQAARWTAGIATGSIVTPQLGRSYGSTDLQLPALEPLPFADELGPVREGMRAAVTGGTAGGLRALPVSAAGKTGSAEDPQAPRGRPNSWFTAYAPYEKPEVVVSVFVRGGGFGSATSGPVAIELLDYWFANRD